MSEKYSFVSLFHDPIPLGGGKETIISRIMVPRIQRPYAQGRTDNVAIAVRKSFLDEIFSLLHGNIHALNLNFVFGRVENRNEQWTMQLLDGQQRLTTLFLLYWYLLNRGMIPPEHEEKVSTAVCAFTYETRDTSKAFCEVLSQKGRRVPVGGNPDVAPGRALRNLLDYFTSYDKDPTVSAMLVMLDAIHAKYGDSCQDVRPQELWERLDKIRFRVISLTQYRLSEELYIKMNARGLPLTPFECFKSDFLGLMDLEVHSTRERAYRKVSLDTGKDDRDGDKEIVSFKQRFGIRLDTVWCDLFWDSDHPEKYDSAFMLFFSRYFTARFVMEHQVGDGYWDDYKIIHDHYEDPETRSHYRGIRPFKSMVERFGADIHYFDDLSNLLDHLKSRKNDILSAMTPLWENHQQDWFCDADAKFEMKPIVTTAAVIEFSRLFPVFPIDVFRIWMKCVNCIVENTDINDISSMVAAAKRLARLLRKIRVSDPRSEDDFIKALGLIDENEFPSAPVTDEIQKAKRIAGSSSQAEASRWIEAFDEIARHPFLKGMIGFFYSQDMTIDEFSAHAALIRSLFCADGITASYRAEPHWMLRAIWAQLTTDSQINGRFLVENNHGKYLKTLVSSLGNNMPREQMRNLFAVKLKGLSSKEPEKIIAKFKDALEKAPSLPPQTSWHLKETIRILREDDGFYKWVFQQGKDIKVYWNYNYKQYQARADGKWSCIMLPVFRIAEQFAKSGGMLPVPVANGRDGFDSRLNMFVGQDLRMRKALANMPNVDAEVRFISDHGRSYPVELWISWKPESLSSDEEEELKNLVEGTAVGTLLDRRGIRINDWSLSPDLGEKNIWIDGLLNEVGKIVSLDPNSSSP